MIQNLIHQYNLLPHPEGGYFKETYRSEESIPANGLPLRFSGGRAFSTAIYFLLLKDLFSAFHRIKSDECWHFYEGESLKVHVLHLNGTYELIRLGKNRDAGEVYQAIVPAGAWFASETSGEYSFVGCTVAPGFDFADFELARAEELKSEYPEYASLIERLCRQ
ncbi:MAG TPA: cupin domain-containing protein [Daejeonella sp.]|jgi:predicted cupin superfamily sugar epimerase|uniref:cupin domain-containing protein n=1 Tax=Daejeonella sp. TaxID=2805397 RepID=UPI002ED8EFAE